MSSLCQSTESSRKARWRTLNNCSLLIYWAVPLFSVLHWAFLFTPILYLFFALLLCTVYSQLVIWHLWKLEIRYGIKEINRDSCREPRICNIIKWKDDKSWGIWFMSKENFKNQCLSNNKNKNRSPEVFWFAVFAF